MYLGTDLGVSGYLGTALALPLPVPRVVHMYPVPALPGYLPYFASCRLPYPMTATASCAGGSGALLWRHVDANDVFLKISKMLKLRASTQTAPKPDQSMAFVPGTRVRHPREQLHLLFQSPTFLSTFVLCEDPCVHF